MKLLYLTQVIRICIQTIHYYVSIIGANYLKIALSYSTKWYTFKQ